VSLALLVALVALVALTVWLGWRHARLLRAMREYGKALRRGMTAPAADVQQLEELSHAVSLNAEALRGELATLASERNRLAAVLDQMTDGVLIANGDGEVQFSNPAAQRIFGITDPRGRTVTEVLRDHQLVEAWGRSRTTHQPQSESVEIPRLHQFLQVVFLPDAHGGGSLMLVQDLTRVHRLETVRRDFVSNISHELRTPLASLRALAETLQGGAISDPQAGPRFLERMVTEVDALTQMSQELLDLSRIESGQVAIERQHVSPAELLRSAAERMKVQADRAAVELTVECPDDIPGIRADPARLEQVLVNLIHNAVKFTRPGGSVLLSAQAAQDVQAQGPREGSAGGSVRFSVRDTGVGIPADDLPRIFERFYRVDRARAGGGTGLGLSIARHIVEAHGGRIWAESIEGKGSRFLFSIPSA
jgi:two-component system phosphate regulon sensor histidine kinase PhoR